MSVLYLKHYVAGRTMIFIDAANILYSQQTLGWDIDYELLIRYFQKETQLVSAYFYSGIVSSNSKQKQFFILIKKLGFILKTKEVKWIKDRNTRSLKGKGNLDIELALDMSQKIDNYDTAILFSGDSDFVPVVEFVKRKKRKVIVISSRGHIAKELIKASDRYIPFEILKELFERKKSPRHSDGGSVFK